MTEILEILPLSPVREWAISRSFMPSTPDELHLRFRQLARQQHGSDRHDIARRLDSPAPAGRAIGIKRFDLVADPDGFTQVVGAPGDANAHLIGFIGMR